jgi:outer membrane receptor protein involved in Fe transport
VCRQRGNLEKTRVQGIEAEAGYRPARNWSGSVGWLFTRARIRRALPELEGKRPPQVPAHSLTLKLSYAAPTLALLSLQGRYLSAQFEDDLNTRELGGFFTADFFAARPLSSRNELFFQVENLFDRSYEVGISGDGIATVGAPRRFQLGLRMKVWS